MAWFGPRGLASVVFALLAVEELGETSPLVGDAVGVVALTVAASVILHGITSGRPGRRFVARDQATRDQANTGSALAPTARPTGFVDSGQD